MSSLSKPNPDESAAAKHLSELRELGRRQSRYERSVINLIASDNAFPVAQSADAPYHGHMIQEGLCGRRPFAGAVIHDEIEELAERLANLIFGMDHANLQPHSCSQANQAVYQALLQPGDRALAMDFRAGGHLTHGLKVNYSGALYDFYHYGVAPDGFIDYNEARQKALLFTPKLIVCGSSAYPRLFDAQRVRAIADEIGAHLMFDLSHEAGLIAGAVVDNPVSFADVVTMSLDKTLRGPFGGMILCRSSLARAIDAAVHPGTQSSFPIRKLTDSAQALALTQTEAFHDYAQRVASSAQQLGEELGGQGIEVVTGGTDKHYLVLDVGRSRAMTGAEAEGRLERIGILSNRQTLPTDASASTASARGLRLGTPWIASRGYMDDDVHNIGLIIRQALTGRETTSLVRQLRRGVRQLTDRWRADDVWNENDKVRSALVKSGAKSIVGRTCYELR